LLAAGVALLALASAVLLVLSGLPHWRWLHADAQSLPWAWRSLLSCAGLAAVHLVLVALAVLAACARRPASPKPRRFPRWLAGAALSLAGLAAPPLLAWLICRRWMLCDVEFDQRVRAFASGLSPLVALAWLLAALYLWVLLELKRRRLTTWQRLDWPIAEACDPAFQGCPTLLGAVRWLLTTTVPSSGWRLLALAALILAPLGLTWQRMQPVVETPAFGHLMLVLWMLPAVLSAISCYRFVRVWRTLRKLLLRVESSPLAPCLGSLSPELAWKPLQAFSWPMPPFQTLILSLVRLKKLVRQGKLALSPEEAAKLLSDLDHFLGLAFAADTEGKAADEIGNRERLEELISATSRGLEPHHDDPDVQIFFAIRVAAYLRYVFAQLRSALMSALGPAFLLLLAVSAYSFEPKGVVSLGLLVLVLGQVCLAVSVFVAMSRDTVLSLIAGTPPGQITFDSPLVSSLLTFGVIPLLGLVATQVPAAGQLLNGVLKPLLRLAGIG
nr:hypothetical protein [Acidobacteriota bacterium]